MKKLAELAIILILFAASCWAQEVRNEVTVQGSGFFQKQTTHAGVTNGASNSGGVMIGYRFKLKRWLAVEGNYDHFKTHEDFESSSGKTFIPMNVHGATGVAIVKLPPLKVAALKIVSPFVLAGGGPMFFDPRGGLVSKKQTRGAFVYGGGLDVPIAKHFLLRAQYRGFIYKVPDFEMTSFKVDKFTHAAVPSAGIVFTF